MNEHEPTKKYDKPPSLGDQDETTDQADPSTVGHDVSTSSAPSSFGDYVLIEEIARGGMGVVYKARQESLNRIVALKMIKSGELANQEQVDRFYKEAEAAANLDHPGIVPVHEVGEFNGQHYFTMAFIEGKSLSVRLRNGPLAPKEAARFAKSIAEAVAFAHSKGVIHRDLKPGNVLITKEGTLRITDFGLAKRIEEDSELTSTGQVLGTPSYMPPEQAEGRLSDIGPAADIYSIGATLYAMLVGRPPFQAANLIETLQQVIGTEPPSPRSLNHNIAVDLDTLCLKCLEKKPSNRYQTAQELIDELNHFLNGEPITARPVGRVEQGLRWCRRKPLAAGLLVVIVALAIGGPWAAIAQSLANMRTARARVDALLNASPATIPLILEDLDRQAGVVRSRLDELDADDSLEAKKRLRVSLALLPYDSMQLDRLKQLLNDCTYEELAVVLDRIKQNGGSKLAPELWTTYLNQSSSANDKFRAGIALAALDPGSSQWSDSDHEFLVNSMLRENTVYQPAIRQALLPMADRLIPRVRLAFLDTELNATVRESAANSLVDFAVDDLEMFTELSMVATSKQHSVLFPKVAARSESDEAIIDAFVDVTKLRPLEHDNETTRVALGKKRAGAAINLLLLDRPDESLEVLRVGDDPESLTQFVHGCRARGIIVTQLLGLFNRATSVTERYGIMLALGEFSATEIPEEIRSTWVDFVKEHYANDPSSGIHGASGWLLRQWGYSEEAKAIEKRAVAYSKDREWFTLGINLNGSGEKSYFTFMVFQAGVYQMGSPDHYELDREWDESVHSVRLTRDFALLDREITRGEYESFRRHRNIADWSRTLDSAMVATDWYDSVRFCRWLTSRWGKSESDQCYGDPLKLDKAKYPADPSPSAEGMPQNWPVELAKSGLRLPTESEWEVACRSGVVSSYSFGCDKSHLEHYGWYQTNSGRQSRVGRELRPNLKGLFDMHGNVNEWCHDWYDSYPLGLQSDPLGASPALNRVARGGGWLLTAADCRAAYRPSLQPTTPATLSGFRLALVPFGEELTKRRQEPIRPAR